MVLAIAITIIVILVKRYIAMQVGSRDTSTHKDVD